MPSPRNWLATPAYQPLGYPWISPWHRTTCQSFTYTFTRPANAPMVATNWEVKFSASLICCSRTSWGTIATLSNQMEVVQSTSTCRDANGCSWMWPWKLEKTGSSATSEGSAVSHARFFPCGIFCEAIPDVRMFADQIGLWWSYGILRLCRD